LKGKGEGRERKVGRRPEKSHLSKKMIFDREKAIEKFVIVIVVKEKQKVQIKAAPTPQHLPPF